MIQINTHLTGRKIRFSYGDKECNGGLVALYIEYKYSEPNNERNQQIVGTEKKAIVVDESGRLFTVSYNSITILN